MQEGLDLFSVACKEFGLTLKTKKAKIMYQPTPAVPYTVPTIIVGGEKLAVVDKLTYLGSTLSRTVNINEEVNYRIACASAAFCRLYASVWERRDIRLHTKLKLYCAVILPSLLYACETWIVYSCHAKQLNSFHMRCLRKLLHKWQDRIPDIKILQRTGMVIRYAMLKRTQLRVAGHAHHMSDDCLQKTCPMVSGK